MKAYFQHILLLIKRLLLALSLFFVARVFFLIYNFDVFSDLDFTTMVHLFVVGLRFDMSVIVYFNLLFILMHLLPLGNIKARSGYQGFLKWYFIIINGLLLFVNLADSIYFNFILKRSTVDVLKLIMLSNDVINLLPSFIVNYWYAPVLLLFVLFLLARVYPKYSIQKANIQSNGQEFKPINIIFRFILFLLLMGLVLIGARGGLQGRPLAIMHASIYVSPKNVPIVLNTPFSMMTTYGHDVLSEINYFSEEQARTLYPVQHQFSFADRTFEKKNVVIILWESYSREYSGLLNHYEGFTPFMDSLMEHSLVFPNAFSNGLRSIDAIPAVVSGLPILMDDPFITSVYSTNAIESLAEIFNSEGYRTAFFHGGNNGTMDFDGFAGYAGFQEYHGVDEYNNKADHDGFWGIFDEPFLQYVAQHLNDFEEPFFAFEFTLSSHNPYHVPVKHKGRFAEGGLKIHKVIRYTDYALQKFFETASKMPWYDNTVFIILADHPAQSTIPSDDKNLKISKPDKKIQQFYGNTVGRFAIPMLIFSPIDSSLKSIDSTTIQQTDIMPTLLDYLGYQKPFFAFGNSVFDDCAKHYAFEFTNGLYQITSGNYSLLFDGEKSIALYNNMEDPTHKKNLISVHKEISARFETDIKAILQQYYNCLINNTLTIQKSKDTGL